MTVRCAFAKLGKIDDGYIFERHLVARVILVKVGRDERDREAREGLCDGADVADAGPRTEQDRPAGSDDEVVDVLLEEARLGDRERALVARLDGEVVVEPTDLGPLVGRIE